MHLGFTYNTGILRVLDVVQICGLLNLKKKERGKQKMELALLKQKRQRRTSWRTLTRWSWCDMSNAYSNRVLEEDAEGSSSGEWSGLQK